MALGKTIQTPTGQVYFWILGYVQRDGFHKTAFAQLKGFENREQSDIPNAICKEHYEYNIPPAVYDTYFDLSVIKADGNCDLTQFYKFIKDYDSRFTDAEDLIYTEVI